MSDLVFKDLSYKLTGIAYKVDSLIGFGQSEKIYADTFALLMKKAKLSFEREVYFPIKVDDKVIKKFFFDFLVEGQIVVELKATEINYKQACTQLFRYLKSSKKKLGIVYRFTKNGVRVKRIPNLY